MNEQEITRSGRAFDDLASGLANGTITRRRALRLAGASLLGVAGLGAAAREAEAAATCPTDTRPGCLTPCTNTRKECTCIRTVEGRKACVRGCCSNRTCDSGSDCRRGEVCMKTGCCNEDQPTCVRRCSEPLPRRCADVEAAGRSSSPAWS
jgi:hypothetical protein